MVCDVRQKKGQGGARRPRDHPRINPRAHLRGQETCNKDESGVDVRVRVWILDVVSELTDLAGQCGAVLRWSQCDQYVRANKFPISELGGRDLISGDSMSLFDMMRPTP